MTVRQIQSLPCGFAGQNRSLVAGVRPALNSRAPWRDTVPRHQYDGLAGLADAIPQGHVDSGLNAGWGASLTASQFDSGHASQKANPAVKGMANPCWLHDKNVWAGEWCCACLNNERELEW